MKIKPCYSEELGRYLAFEATRAMDRKDLKELVAELTSAGIQFGSLSIHGKLTEVNLPVKMKST